jgi:hypothetical protein
LSALLALPQVTLIAVSSVNLEATVAALTASMRGIAFGAVKLLSDRRPPHLPANISWTPIDRLGSAADYSNFILKHLADYVDTSHGLLIQWDGHVLRADCWRDAFLSCDYIGARWPQFVDGYDVGNGGFSLRSRALLAACQAADFVPSHPEDLAICRANRAMLEARGIQFASRELADAFSAERAGDPAQSFGYHGVWHMPQVLGRDVFWSIYRELDDRSTVRHDAATLMWQVARGPTGPWRAWRLIRDQLRDSAARKRTAP